MARVEDSAHGGDVDARRLEQGVAEPRFVFEIAALLLKDPANKREAVRMGAAGSERHKCIAGLDAGAVDNVPFFDDAHGEACEIVFPAAVEARHLGGFAPCKSAAGELAAARDAFDDPRRDVDIQAGSGVVVEEEEGLGADDEAVVHAHGNKILADAIVAVMVDGQAQLCADAIRSGHEHGSLVTLRQARQRCESADAAEYLRAARSCCGRRNAPDERRARINIDASIAIGEADRASFSLFHERCALTGSLSERIGYTAHRRGGVCAAARFGKVADGIRTSP